MSSSLDHIGEEIAADVTHHDAALHRILTKLRIFDAGGGFVSQGFRTCAQWLSWRVNWTLNTAREHIRVANALGTLPMIDRALEGGQLSYCKVRALTRVATPANEAALLEMALYMTGHHLDQLCRRVASVKKHDEAACPRDDVERRYVHRRYRDDGMVMVEAVLHPEEADIVFAAIERIAKERCREREVVDSPAVAVDSAGVLASVAPVDGAAVDVAADTDAADAVEPVDAAVGAADIDVAGAVAGAQVDVAAVHLAAVDITADTDVAAVASAVVDNGAPAAAVEPVDAAVGAADIDVAGAVAGAQVDVAAVHLAADIDIAGAVPGAQVDGAAVDVGGDIDAATAAVASAVVANAAPSAPKSVAPTPAEAFRQRSSRVDRVRQPPKAFDRATALVEMAQHVLRGTSPDRSPVDVMITIPLETLASSRTGHIKSCGAHSAGDTPCCSAAACGAGSAASGCGPDPMRVAFGGDGSFVSAVAARRLACDAGVISLVEDANGNALSAGRKTRTISGSLKRAMLRRDHKCRYPGCNARAFLEGHHVKHWADGGATEIGNVISLCGYHHRFVHEYGFRIEFDATTNTVSVFDPARERWMRGVTRPDPQADLAWSNMRYRDPSITADTQPLWDATPVDYVEIVDIILRAEDRAARAAAADDETD